MAEINKTINLLPNKGSILNQFLSWSLTIGRLLVIITEALALGVFLYRFSIDMLLVDLHDKIDNASLIVAALKPTEDIYRDLHTRLAYAKTYDTTDDKTLTVIKEIIKIGTNKVTFRSIAVSSKSIEIEIQAPSVDALSFFTSKLREYPEVINVSVDRVENKSASAQVIVGLSADLKQ